MSSSVAIRELPTHVLARHVRAMPRSARPTGAMILEQAGTLVVGPFAGPPVAPNASHARGDNVDDRSSALGV